MNTAKTLGVVCFVVPLMLSACAKGPDPKQIAAGQQVFLATCATCHGKDANGLPKLGKNLHHNEFIQSKSDQELLDYVKVGRPADDPANTTHVAMPPKGGNPALTDTDIANAVAYLRTLQE